MDKTEQLIHMMNHPHDYDADEWQQILQDEECREMYSLMAKTRGALYADRAEEQLSDEAIDAEWDKLMTENSNGNAANLKVAASFIGLMIVSVIAFAAIHSIHHSDVPRHDDNHPAIVEHSRQATIDSLVVDKDSVSAQPVIYDNVPVEQLLDDIAKYYNAEVNITNDDVRGLRFYFVWHREQGLEQVVTDLNHFEHLHLTLNDNQIIVE